ncbi:hypothetical protein PLESTB_000857300 [Pleodorina starrii]|uniref:Uncharacterized protein n=1 Tax=Pleodorina starrii TaxID=330485 RepID=A0A9W6BLH2_9CHLO|nr:hypothetical protein PLESTB_000857300 [Pleodorina starrii]
MFCFSRWLGVQTPPAWLPMATSSTCAPGGALWPPGTREPRPAPWVSAAAAAMAAAQMKPSPAAASAGCQHGQQRWLRTQQRQRVSATAATV